jgi:hypothetical protein
MKYLLQNKKLAFSFIPSYVLCYSGSYYQANGILSFAIMDLALKIRKQQKRKFIVLKKRKPIIYLLNYVDTFNLNLSSSKLDIDFLSKNNYKKELAYNLYLYRRKKNFVYEDSLIVIERENLCIIRFEDNYPRRIQPKNLNLVAMLMHILEKNEIDTLYDADGIIFYCLLLM